MVDYLLLVVLLDFHYLADNQVRKDCLHNLLGPELHQLVVLPHSFVLGMNQQLQHQLLL